MGNLPLMDQTSSFPTLWQGFDPNPFITLEPSLPDKANFATPFSAPNPFTDNAESRIPSLDKLRAFAPRNGEINGYLKVKIHLHGLREEQPAPRPLYHHPGKRSRPEDEEEQLKQPEAERMVAQALHMCQEGEILRSPPNYGLNCNLSIVERKLFRFCKLFSPATKRHV